MSHVWASNVGKYAAHTDAGLVKGVVRYFNGDLDWRLISTAPYNRDVEAARGKPPRGLAPPPFLAIKRMADGSIRILERG